MAKLADAADRQADSATVIHLARHVPGKVEFGFTVADVEAFYRLRTGTRRVLQH